MSTQGLRLLLASAATVLAALLTTVTASAITTTGAFMTKGGGTSVNDSPTIGYGLCMENDCGTSWGTVDCVKEQACGATLQSAQTFTLNGNGYIQYGTSGKCLDIKSNNPALGELDLWTCGDVNNPNNAQVWEYQTDIANGYYGVLESVHHPGYCIDLHGDSETLGTKLDIAPCNGTYAQDFVPAYFTLSIWSDVAANRCLGYNTTTQDYESLTCSIGTDHTQDFVFLPSNAIAGYHAQLQGDWLSGGYAPNGAGIDYDGGNGAATFVGYPPGQWYNFAYTPYLVEEYFGGLLNVKCLDVLGGSSTSGTEVDETQCNGTDAQIWLLDVRGL